MKKSPYPLIRLQDRQPVAHTTHYADTYWLRLRGLMGRPPLAPGEALWILPCQQVHTSFMKVPLDVVFLDKELTVLRVVHDLKPWRVSPWVRAAHSVLEFSADAGLQLQAGDRLAFVRGN